MLVRAKGECEHRINETAATRSGAVGRTECDRREAHAWHEGLPSFPASSSSSFLSNKQARGLGYFDVFSLQCSASTELAGTNSISIRAVHPWLRKTLRASADGRSRAT